mgnify:CR=1 FL=1
MFAGLASIPKNIEAANGLVEQVLGELSVNDLLRLMVAPGDRDDFNPVILKSLISKGYSVAEEKIKWVCLKKFLDQKLGHLAKAHLQQLAHLY